MQNFTSKAVKSFGIQLLSWLLIIQVAIGSSVLTLNRALAGPGDDAPDTKLTIIDQITRAGSNDPVTVQGRADAESFANEIETAGPNDFPKATTDAFHITGQTLEILSGKEAGSYDLSSLKIGLPPIFPDFAKEVKVEVNRANKEIAIVYYKGGEAIAKHALHGFDVVAFAQDKEMLQFVDANGKMFVVDMIFARSAGFKAPMPVFEVGSLPEGKVVSNLEVAFASRGLEPPTVVPEDAILPNDVETKDLWTAGDFVAYFKNATGKRELVGVYNRGVSQMQMYTGEAVVAFLATMISPPENDAAIGGASAALSDPMIAARARESAGQLDELTRDALTAFPDKAVEKLRARSLGNKARAASDRDRFEFDEWLKSFEKLREKAQAEADQVRAKADWAKAEGKKDAKNKARAEELEGALKAGDLGGEWQSAVTAANAKEVKQRSIFYRVMTHKAMKFLAVVTGGYLAVKGIGVLNDMQLSPESARPLAWSVHTANWLFAHVWPNVLKDGAYRATLFKSFFTLSSFIPALHIVGLVYGKAKGWSAQKAKAVIGIRAYAAIQLPFWVRLARIAKQPNLMPALQLGINPFGKIKADSELGKKLGLEEDVRPGVSFGSNDRAHDIKIKRRVLEAIAVQKNRLRAYSFLLANIAVGEKYGIDPATMLMARGGKIADPEAAKLLNDPKFAKEWLQVAHELSGVLLDMKNGGYLADVAQLDPNEILEDYATAKQTAQDIASRGRLASLVTQLKTHWKEFGSRAAKGFGRYGIEENEFLKNVDPSDAVVSASWQQFFADYMLAVFQMGMVGDRADLTKPDKLAADANGILFTNKGHFTDMVDQAVRAYGLQNPSDLALVFQKEAAPTEDRYDPIENITQVGEPRVDTFVAGMLSWSKNVLSLRKANYGAIYWKSFKKKFKTLQAGFILSMAARVGLAGQGFAQALTGYGYLFFLGMPGYAWPWMPITQGNDNYVEGIKAADGEFLRAKAKIAQGKRLRDVALLNEGYTDLSGIYSKHNDGDLPKEFRQGLTAAEEMLSIPTEARLSELKKIENFYGQAARLKQAIDAGNEDEIRSTYDEVRGQYEAANPGAGISQAMQELNAHALLEVSLKTPPFRNRAHPMITWFWTYAASFATTYLATALFATSYGSTMSTSIFLSAVGLSAKFYAGTYFGQKLINKLGERIDFIRSKDRKAKAIADGTYKEVKVIVPEAYADFRKAYIEAKAAEFKVEPKDIEASIDHKLEEALKLRHQVELKRSSCAALLTSADAIKPLSFGQKAKIIFRGVPSSN